MNEMEAIAAALTRIGNVLERIAVCLEAQEERGFVLSANVGTGD